MPFFNFPITRVQRERDASDPDKFWIVNENMFINQLRYILKDVRKFVTLTGEIVILDFSSFPIGKQK